jgi:hypothetical protein
MTGADLHIEVRDQDVIVTMTETSFRVVYRKPYQGSQLVARLDYFQHNQKGPITRAQFSLGPGSSPTTRRVSWVGLCEGADRSRRPRLIIKAMQLPSYR